MMKVYFILTDICIKFAEFCINFYNSLRFLLDWASLLMDAGQKYHDNGKQLLQERSIRGSSLRLWGALDDFEENILPEGEVPITIAFNTSREVGIARDFHMISDDIVRFLMEFPSQLDPTTGQSIHFKIWHNVNRGAIQPRPVYYVRNGKTSLELIGLVPVIQDDPVRALIDG